MDLENPRVCPFIQKINWLCYSIIVAQSGKLSEVIETI
jgi:hypothetical protein